MHDETPHGLALARRTIAAWQQDNQNALRARLARENLKPSQVYRRAAVRALAAILAPLGIIAYVYGFGILAALIAG